MFDNLDKLRSKKWDYAILALFVVFIAGKCCGARAETGTAKVTIVDSVVVSSGSVYTE